MCRKAAIGCFIFLITTVYYSSADVSHLAGVNSFPGFKHSSGGDVPVVNDLNTRSLDQQNWNIRDSIPGEPDVDYPIFSVPPATSFSCKDRHYGYYADVEARCQVFRVCATTDLTGKGFAFLCPNGTLFNQKYFVCDWYKNVDCFASEGYFARNELIGPRMGLMSKNDMMSVIQVMVDYTKQPQFNNQKINNNGGFPFTNSGFPKQFGNNQGLINQNNGLTPDAGNIGSNSFNKQPEGNAIPNKDRTNVSAHVPQRGSEVLSQPIFPSDSSRPTSSTQNQGTAENVIPNNNSGVSQLNQNSNFDTNGNKPVANSNENNYQPPTLFVSSLGEVSADPNLRYNPFTTALVSTRTFDTLPSNVDAVSTSSGSGRKFASHSQFNQLIGNTQPANRENNFNDGPSHQNTGSNKKITLQQEINHLTIGQSNNQQSTQQSSVHSQPPTINAIKASSILGTNINPASQTGQSLTAVYTGSGDLLSHTINQYGKNDQSSAQVQDPNLSALVNSLGETLTPVFTGEGNLLSHTIGQTGSSLQPQNDAKIHQEQGESRTVTQSVASTPQPLLQTPQYSAHTGVTNVPLSIGQKGAGSTPSHQLATGQSSIGGNIVYSGEGNLLSQSIGQRGGQSVSNNQVGQKHTDSVGRTTNTEAGSQSIQGSTTDYSSRNQGVYNKASSSSDAITHTAQPIQIGQNKFLSQTKQQSLQSQSVTQPAYNNRISFGQNVSTKPAQTIPTAAPYSPSIPPFRSTTSSIITPTATSYNQQSQSSNTQNYKSQSTYDQGNNFQSSFSNNQFQVPAKDYLPGTDNTRTARTNELSFGNHGSSALKSTSSQNVGRDRFGGSQQDVKQQFTYPADETDTKLLDNANNLPYLGVDADTTKQNLTNRDVTHLNKYLYRQQTEPTRNDTIEQTIITSERNVNNKLPSISIGDIADLNRILLEVGNLDESDEANATEEFNSESDNFTISPIIVLPEDNILTEDEDASNDIEDSQVLKKFDESANLLFKGLQLSLYEERELANSEIKNELNDDIFRSQDVNEEKVRNAKDVYSSGGGLKQSNSIRLIFERAKNRSGDFRVKLKSKKEEENKAKRTFALPQKTAEEKLVTILKPLLKNITVAPNRYIENNTKIGGFINNDSKFSQRHSLAPRILFKNVKTIEDIERIATRIDTNNSEDDVLTSETRHSNRIVFPNSIKLRTIYDSDKSTTNTDDTKMTVSSIEPSMELINKDKDWSFYTKTMLVPQRNQRKAVRDHETAASNRQSYASTYSSSHSQQYNYNQRSPPSTVYNHYPQYKQQQQQPIHYATIDNRPNPSHSTFQAPPLQSNYPTSIQNNPQPSSYHNSVSNYYIPPVPSAIQSSIPQSLPTIVHPPTQFHSTQHNSFSPNQLRRTTQNEKVVVKIIPATGWYLNDANERQSFLDAVSRGLLSDKGYVYVNDVQSGQRQSNLNVQPPQQPQHTQQPQQTQQPQHTQQPQQPQQSQQPQSTGRSQIDIDEEAYFKGSSSYESPLNSVGKLPGDSDSVSGYFDSSTSESVGYQYQHPRRSFTT